MAPCSTIDLKKAVLLSLELSRAGRFSVHKRPGAGWTGYEELWDLWSASISPSWRQRLGTDTSSQRREVFRVVVEVQSSNLGDDESEVSRLAFILRHYSRSVSKNVFLQKGESLDTKDSALDENAIPRQSQSHALLEAKSNSRMPSNSELSWSNHLITLGAKE